MNFDSRSLPEPTKLEESFIKQYPEDVQKKLQEIRSTKMIIEQKHHYIKHRVDELLENIRKQIFKDGDEILNLKLKSLEEMEKKVRDTRLLLTDNCMNIPESIRDISEIEEIDSFHDQLLSHISFDFITDISDAKYCLGYIESFPLKPKDLTLEINELNKYEIGTDFEVTVRSKKSWYFMTLRSLAGYAENENGIKILPKILDKEDGTYIFLFVLDDFSKYYIEITLYGRPIKNSPLIVKIEPSVRSNRCKTSIPRTLSPSNEGKHPFKDGKLLNKYNQKFKEEEKHLDTKTSTLNPVYRKDKVRIDTNGEELIEDKNYDPKNDCIENRRNDINKTDSLDGEEDSVTLTAYLLSTITKQNGVDLYFPIGVSVKQSNDIIICDTGHHMVWIVDESGKPKQKITQRKQGVNLYRPSAVVVTEDDNFVVKDNHGLHLYSQNGIFIRSIGERILQKPYGLAITEDEKLITLNETSTPSLFVFNKDGGIENENLFEPLAERSAASKCRFLASYSNEVVVSDLGLSKIYKTTMDGQLIKEFGSYGITDGAMNEPSGITLDPKGTMLIGDSKNDRIQIFDWNGEFLGNVIFTSPIRRPSDIALTKDGRLYVANYLDHYISVFRLKIGD
ncbi:tripartite motif-containing protein 3-like isoform X2 [Centruroides sculpturatus]|uniref:tripartite motif-containing protein 3-like isoform X2 n=1 Tax=Centruroides sculpturatus TaxID=218467 RepID=UPI000C6DE4F1|nr:tripartite motif-containing protein 3-like isoform X2 [Centruroides sculpturatus]